MRLPENFEKKMRDLLKEDFDNYIACYEEPRYYGLRVNTNKISVEEFKKICPFEIEPIPWIENGFYYDGEHVTPSKHPYYFAGLYYLQEPSAMTPANRLPVEPGDKVLDVCAAPGGKATELGAKLSGTGLLVSNDISASRAKALVKNIEVFGIGNVVITCEYPEKLAAKFPEFFDKILVDAPCSGEGMFRKNPYAMKEWSQEHVKMCAKRQLSILNTATKALKDGGIMVYSTCTFSLEENEQTVYNFLKENPDFALENIDCDFGRAAQQLILDENLVDTSRARRIFPQDGGEGHFVAKFKKKSANSKKVKDFNYKKAKAAENKIGYDYFSTLFKCEAYGKIEKISNNFIILPEGLPDISGLNVLRAGVLLATNKGSILEPAHAAFMAAKAEELRTKIDFSCDSKEILAYLKGEEISVPEDMCGYVGVCVDGIVAGYAKAINGRLKNKYPKGLRIF